MNRTQTPLLPRHSIAPEMGAKLKPQTTPRPNHTHRARRPALADGFDVRDAADTETGGVPALASGDVRSAGEEVRAASELIHCLVVVAVGAVR